jgi:hypothetical protein
MILVSKINKNTSIMIKHTTEQKLISFSILIQSHKARMMWFGTNMIKEYFLMRITYNMLIPANAMIL